MSARGGAGNIYHATQSRLSTSDPDPEAARSSASLGMLPEINPSDPPSRSTYAHTGRGGAGNWYQPQELAETGTYDLSSGGKSAKDGRALWSGRGGAGNFVAGDASASAGTQERSSEAVEARRRAEEDVEKGVVRPEKAFLGGKERTSDARDAVEAVTSTGTSTSTSGMEMTGMAL